MKKYVIAKLALSAIAVSAFLATNAANTPEASPTGSGEAVSGIITDSERHALPGAVITVEDTPTGVVNRAMMASTMWLIQPEHWLAR